MAKIIRYEKKRVSGKNTIELDYVILDREKSFFKDFSVEENIVKIRCYLVLTNIYNKDMKFSIKAKAPPEDVGKLLKNENLYIIENGKEKVFELKAKERKGINVIFEGEYGGNNQKQNRLLPREIEIVIKE